MDSQRLADHDLPELDALRPDAASAGAEAPASPKPAAQPVVVVHYRPRRWAATLLPPAVLVLLACGLLSLRIHTPDWLGLVPSRKTATVAAAPAPAEDRGPAPTRSDRAVEPPRTVGAAPEPGSEPAPPTVVVEPAPAEPASVVTAVPAADGPDAPRIRPGGLWEPMVLAGPPVGAVRRPAPGEELYGPPRGETRRAASEPPVAAQAPDAPAPGAAWDEIRREAETVRAERAALEGAKGRLLAEQDVETRRADLRLRRDFLERLRASLKDAPRNAQAIRTLMANEPAGDHGDTSDLRALIQAGATTRTARRALIRQLRGRGVSEPIILGALEEVFLANAATRNGPRSAEEALLRAAGELVAEPLPRIAREPEPKAAEPGTAVRRRPAADARPPDAPPRGPRATPNDASGVSVRRR